MTSRTESAAVAVAAIAFCAFYAWLAGQDANWDLRNYHMYAVDAWLHGQTFWHLAPAQVQSWLNPLPHLLQFVLISFTPPVVAGMTMGAVAGINGWLVWLLMRRLHGWSADLPSRLLAIGVAAMALTGPMFLSMVGASWAEYICSPFVLIALIALVPGNPAADGARMGRRQTAGIAVQPRALLLSGLAMGLACGLKLTHLVYAIGLAGAMVLVAPRAALTWPGLAFAAGGAAGYLITGGFWALTLLRHFGSPIFPYFNAVFGSAMIAPVNWSDPRFVPHSVLAAAVTYPFDWMLGRHPSNEVPFRDARFALVAVLVPAAVCLAISRGRRGSQEHTNSRQRFWFVVCFFVISYVVWLTVFGIQRFVLPLELIAGVVLAVSLHEILAVRRHAVAVFALFAVLLVAWTKPANWGRIPYGPDWFHVSARPTDEPAMYVLVGENPMSYVIRFMPRHDRFVRINGNLPLRPDEYLGREAQRLIREHRGPIRTLSTEPVRDVDRTILSAFGLGVVSPERCDHITTTMDVLLACDAVRLPPR